MKEYDTDAKKLGQQTVDDLARERARLRVPDPAKIPADLEAFAGEMLSIVGEARMNPSDSGMPVVPHGRDSHKSNSKQSSSHQHWFPQREAELNPNVQRYDEHCRSRGLRTFDQRVHDHAKTQLDKK